MASPRGRHWPDRPCLSRRPSSPGWPSGSGCSVALRTVSRSSWVVSLLLTRRLHSLRFVQAEGLGFRLGFPLKPDSLNPVSRLLQGFCKGLQRCGLGGGWAAERGHCRAHDHKCDAAPLPRGQSRTKQPGEKQLAADETAPAGPPYRERTASRGSPVRSARAVTPHMPP